MDLATAYREGQEELAIAAQRPDITAFAIVIDIDGEMVELVTQCDTQGRVDWRDLLGVHLTEDIDRNWAMAWEDSQGVVHHAGPNLLYVKRAQANLAKYRFRERGLRLTVENNDDFDAPFVLIGEDGDVPVEEDCGVMPFERPGIVEIHGLHEGDAPWGAAWRPYTLPAVTKDNPEPNPVFHGVIAALGSNTRATYEAVLAVAHLN